MPFRDSAAIAAGVTQFLSDPAMMTGMRKRAWKLGREMIWPVVARRYMESFARARVRSTALRAKPLPFARWKIAPTNFRR